MTTPSATAPRLPWDAANPYPFYEDRRRDGDVVWDDTAQAWLILGYDAAREVLGGSGWTSNPLANPNARAAIDSMGSDLVDRSMLFSDGANHDRLRGSVRDVFTRSFITGLTAGVEAIAAAVVDHPPTSTTFDFMAEIALPLPIAVAGEWLGLDPESSRLLREQSPAIIRMLGTLADADDIAAGAAAFAALLTQFLPLAADRRSNPADDLISFITSDPDLELDDVVVTAILIAVAGHETTANLLGAAMLRLLAVKSGGNQIVDPALISELLRLDGPVQATARTATEDQRIGGVDIACGQQAVAVVAAANRDPAVFDEPDQFRPDRIGPAPLSFGYGAHYCLGAALARLEITVALREILARKPVLAGPAVWRDTTAIRGPLNVPMVFRK
ncbi:cytochrome P450 [Mycobacterium celatum]|uniref:Cytochrome n=1 Tax=Mycobacterium celatum TaxID=28045 RepID=A0A1X1RUB2_MYCCE|nr:cytochrome P450 [Mycobacterium celatum]ORV18031.1 cytochrome [Mycobacterium celatum]PIB80434.1 cytochrome P450 [Mycobacterium celatum]